MFCSRTTKNDGCITIQCHRGYGCDKVSAKAGAASHPLECPDSSQSDINESIAASLEDKEADYFVEEATANMTDNPELEGMNSSNNNKRIHVSKMTDTQKVLSCII